MAIGRTTFSLHCWRTRRPWVDPAAPFRSTEAIVKRTLSFALALFALLAASFAMAAGQAPAVKPLGTILSIDFSGSVAVIDLKDLLAPYGASADQEPDGSHWYVMSATNGSVRPVTRVLMAADPPDAPLQIFPRRARPMILQVASSDSGVIVERLHALGHHAYQVTIPPATSASVAVRVAYADPKPEILAWNEPALVAHNRQLAVFLA